MLHIVSAASLPGSPAVPNEDWFASGPSWAVVLDGVTRVPDDGCIHDVPWYVATLGNALAGDLSGTTKSLNAILADAIHAVNNAHKDTCDLANPQSPASQVAILRERHGAMEWLILGDCTVVLEREGEPPVAYCDDRVDRLPNPPEPVLINGVRRYPLDYIARVRNQPGSDGFWVASTAPEAADEALYGSWPANEVRAIALLSDGLTRLVERYGWTWEDLLEAGAARGVPDLIRVVHEADRAAGATGGRGKASDDATGVLLASY
jgi:hypothetical protein